MKLEESSFSRLILLEAAVLSVSNIVDLLIYVIGEIAFTIHLPFGLLKSWHENKKPVLENYSYVQILNAFIGEWYPTKINENCLRIEEQLRIICSDVVKQFLCKTGRRRHDLLTKVKNIAIYKNELSTVNLVSDLERQVSHLQSVNASIIHDNKLLELKYIEKDVALADSTIKVKISGDGAKMTRLTNFVIISFSILNAEDTVISSKGNHTIAVIKGHEDYDLLKVSCAKIFDCINRLARKGTVKVRDKDIRIEMFLGGDYKFLLLILGMKGATSDFACIWCKIHKLLSATISKSPTFFRNYAITQNKKDIKSCALKSAFSCQHQPLLDIKLENVVLDELHLMLRITVIA
ncbi:Hypothetical predicted protein, partial [Paramuricea clavata]